MGLPTVRRSNLVILTQVGVEGALAVGWSILAAKATRVSRNVRITTTTIVHVDHGLRVDVGHVVGRSLLREDESSYDGNRRQDWSRTQRVKKKNGLIPHPQQTQLSLAG